MPHDSGALPLPDALAAPVRYHLGDGDAVLGRVLPRPSIDRAEALRYLGYRGQDVDEALAARIEAVFTRTEQAFAPRGVSRAFPVDARGLDAQGEPCIRLAGTAVELTGRAIFCHLKDACAAVVLAVTLGMESERALRRHRAGGGVEAAVLDAACSALVEAAADAVDQSAKQDAARFGLTGNQRFSCGYGDCPLSCQQGLLDALDARRALGITLTPSYLMVPTKSITAVFGLFDAAVPHGDAARTCRACRVGPGCAFRARGTTCWRTAS